MMLLPAKLRAPGWYRAAFATVLGFGFAVGSFSESDEIRSAQSASDVNGVKLRVLGAGERVTVRGWSRAIGVWDRALDVDVPDAGWARVVVRATP